MMNASRFSIGPIKSRKELSALLDILAPTFNFTREAGDQYSKIVGVKNYRVVRRGGRVVGGCALLPMGQFFGGKSVPMMGVAAVGISPDQRGLGTATALMKSAVLEMHKRGYPISALYPATLPLYRGVGYEHAGHRFDIRLPAKTMVFKQRENGMEMRPISPKDDRAVRALYQERAIRSAGNLDRGDFIWFRVREPRGVKAHGYIVANPATKKAEGYVYYVQKESGVPADLAHSALSLHLTDLVALTPAAGRKLLSFLADHRSMIDQVVFQGSPSDPILKLLPDRNYSARLLDHWMLRVVDVPAALEARGYPPNVEAEVHFEVSDDLIESNNGRYVLRIKNGAATVKSGGRGDLVIDVRGMAALYSGHLSPPDLLVAGRLTLAARLKNADRVLGEAASVFAGPAPWLGDMF